MVVFYGVEHAMKIINDYITVISRLVSSLSLLLLIYGRIITASISVLTLAS